MSSYKYCKAVVYQMYLLLYSSQDLELARDLHIRCGAPMVEAGSDSEAGGWTLQ
jgi:hypothetical protein